MYSKNFILSLVSIVVFSALAAVSVLIYRGDTERAVELNESDLALRAQAFISSAGRILDKASGREVAEEGVKAVEQEATPVIETLKSEWQKNAKLDEILLANIKENILKIRASFRDNFLKK